MCIGDRIGGGAGHCGECAAGETFCALPDQPGLCISCPAGQEPDPTNDCKCVCKSGTTACGTNCCNPDTETCCDGTCIATADFCGGTCKVCAKGERCCNDTCVAGNECCETDDCDQKVCQTRDCVDGTCDYTPVDDGQQGPLCNGNGEFCCNGEDCCEAGQVCTGNGCCTPKTCAKDYPGQCGAFSQGCGLPDLNCTCSQGESCCRGTCISAEQCCETSDCDQKLCQDRDCVERDCQYTPVKDGDPGPLCNNEGEFCCKEACCEPGAVCTDNGCCTPKTCARDYPGQCGAFADGCGGTLNCTCGEGQGCCEGTCVEGEQCCADTDCPAEICQTAACDDGTCDYTPVDDGEPGPLCDGEGEFCCNGEDCCEAGDVCTGTGCCTPQTCAAFPGLCGAQDDGCGGTLECSCPSGQTCLEDDTCCIPQTKEEACAGSNVVCGTVADGCGGTIDCKCPTDCKDTDDGPNNTCVDGECVCTPDTCPTSGKQGDPCGDFPDGCCDTYPCNCTTECPDGGANNKCKDGTCTCKADTCPTSGFAGDPCGDFPDGCCDTYPCNCTQTCPDGKGTYANGNNCDPKTGTCVCKPTSEADACKGNCGKTVSDGCCGTITCPKCCDSCTQGYYKQNQCGSPAGTNWNSDVLPTTKLADVCSSCYPKGSAIATYCIGKGFDTLGKALTAKGNDVICAQFAAAIINAGLTNTGDNTHCVKNRCKDVCALPNNSASNQQLTLLNEGAGQGFEICPNKGCGNA